MRTVQPALWDARSKWYNIGIQLGCEVSDLDAIKTSNCSNVDVCMTNMLASWLRKGSPTPTWKSVVEALQSSTVKEVQIANIVAEKYLDLDLKEKPEYSGKVDQVKRVERISQACDKAVVTEAKTGQCIKKIPELCDEEKVGLFELRLKTESGTIQLSFFTLCRQFFESLDAQNLCINELVEGLKELKVLKYVSPPRSESAQKSYEDFLGSITDVKGVKSVIKENSSFFDFRPLEHMILNFGLESDKKQLKKYKEEFEHYIKSRTFEFPTEVVIGQTRASNSTDLLVKVETDYKTLVEFKQFQCQISCVLNIAIDALHLKLVKDGCIQLIFLIPNFVQEVIFPLSPEQEVELTELGVIELSCGDYHFPHEVRSYPYTYV